MNIDRDSGSRAGVTVETRVICDTGLELLCNQEFESRSTRNHLQDLAPVPRSRQDHQLPEFGTLGPVEAAAGSISPDPTETDMVPFRQFQKIDTGGQGATECVSATPPDPVGSSLQLSRTFSPRL